MNSCSCRGAGCKMCRGAAPQTIVIPIEPMGAVRTTQRQKFVDTRAKRYHEYKTYIAYHIATQVKPIPAGIPVIVNNLTFYMPIPKSWSEAEKEKHRGQPHIKKPDIDNLIKGLFDSANKYAWADDNQVCEIRNVKKVYSDDPRIEFSLLTL